jgi:hypothetical protein
MTIEFVELPKTEGFVDVCIIDGGGLIGNSIIMHAGESARDIPMSCWVFYIHHPQTGKKLLWDVGISAVPPLPRLLTQNRDDYSESMQKTFYDPAKAFGPPQDLPTQLEKRRGIKADEIDAVLFSHAHWYLPLPAGQL